MPTLAAILPTPFPRILPLFGLQIVMALGLGLVVASTAHAIVWDVAGNGSWDNHGNWRGGKRPDAADLAEFVDQDFSGPVTITLESDQSADGLTFADTDPSTTPCNWTLGGGNFALALGSSPVQVVNETATINAGISGSQGLTKTGGGTLVLGQANSIVGTVSVNAGTLKISNLAQLGATANPVTIAHGAKLHIAESITVTNTRWFTFGTDGGTIDVSGNRECRFLQGGVTLNGTLTKTGAGNLILTRSGSGAGGTVVDEGVLGISQADSLGSGPIRLNGGAFFYNQSGMTNLTAPIQMAGGTLYPVFDHSIETSGTGKRYASDVTLVNGTTSSVRSLDGNALLKLVNPKVDERHIVLAGKISGGGNLELMAKDDGTAATKNIEFWNPANDLTGTITVHAGVSFVARGDGATLGGTTAERSTIRFFDTGWPTVPGRLSLRNDNATATDYLTDLIIDAAAIIDVNRNQNAGTVNSVLSFYDLSLGSYPLTITGGNGFQMRIDGTTTLDADATIDTQTANLLLQGPVVGTGGLTKQGQERLALLNENISYRGDTRVEGGVLQITAGLDNGGTWTYDTIVGTDSSTAELITAHVRQDALTIQAGSKVTIQGAGAANATSVVNFLNIANGLGGFTWGVSNNGAAPASTTDSPTAVPEPAAWLLLTIAIGASLATRRRS